MQRTSWTRFTYSVASTRYSRPCCSISVPVGYAAPFLIDWDGDGLDDLLVGQFGYGRIRIYKNRGTAKQPKYEDFTYFQAGGTTGAVPCG